MKRAKPKKRRDRSSGQSPYDKYGKRPYHYSDKYYEWRQSVTRSAKTAL